MKSLKQNTIRLRLSERLYEILPVDGLHDHVFSRLWVILPNGSDFKVQLKRQNKMGIFQSKAKTDLETFRRMIYRFIYIHHQAPEWYEDVVRYYDLETLVESRLSKYSENPHSFNHHLEVLEEV